MTAVNSFLCGYREVHKRCIISGRDVRTENLFTRAYPSCLLDTG